MLRINEGELQIGALQLPLDIFGKNHLDHTHLNVKVAMQKCLLRGY